MARTFFRVVQGEVATRGDFLSYQAMGKPLWNPTPERIRRWNGISVFETEALARVKARDYKLGPYIAKLLVPDESVIEVEQTGRSGHFTLYSATDDFLKSFITVVPVEE